MYLFRGEMSNRTLHFWFLAPARREVLLAGKYAAGLIASAVIFGGGALLTLAAMIWPHDAVEVQAYWNAGGMGHVFWYAAAAALGCVGYGSVFLAVGLYVRNPIIPAAVLLAWEGVNGILPHVLQKMSILYYLQSLCPVPAPMDDDAPTLIRLLAAPAAPASRPGAILGLLLLTAFVLWIASLAVRRMQISYGDRNVMPRGVFRLLARYRRGSLCPTCAAFSVSHVRKSCAASPNTPGRPAFPRMLFDHAPACRSNGPIRKRLLPRRFAPQNAQLNRQPGEVVIAPLVRDQTVFHLEQTHALDVELSSRSWQPHEFRRVSRVHDELLGDPIAIH